MMEPPYSSALLKQILLYIKDTLGQVVPYQDVQTVVNSLTELSCFTQTLTMSPLCLE